MEHCTYQTIHRQLYMHELSTFVMTSQWHSQITDMHDLQDIYMGYAFRKPVKVLRHCKYYCKMLLAVNHIL